MGSMGFEQEMQVHAVRDTGADRHRRPMAWKSVALAILVFSIGIALVFPKALFELLLPDQTVYNHNFSDRLFSRVKVGMTEREVLQVLGPPLEVSEYVGPRVYRSNWAEGASAVAGVEFRWWAYSKPGKLSDSYHVRAIRFAPDGRVTEVTDRYYAD